MSQTTGEYSLSTFTPGEEAVLGDHSRTTCVNCGRSFPIDIEDPPRAVCDYCLLVGYDRGRGRE